MSVSKKSLLIPLIALILVIVVWGGSILWNSRVTNIVTLGDSIGAGFCETIPWGIRLGQGLNVPVVNDSVAGRTLSEGLELVDELLAANKPSHLVVLLGTNDALFGDADTAISTMNAIVQRARSAGVNVVIGTLPPIFRSSEVNDRSKQITDGYQNIKGAVVADIRSAMGNDKSLFCDSVHPNTLGQTAIVTAYLEVF